MTEISLDEYRICMLSSETIAAMAEFISTLTMSKDASRVMPSRFQVEGPVQPAPPLVQWICTPEDLRGATVREVDGLYYSCKPRNFRIRKSSFHATGRSFQNRSTCHGRVDVPATQREMKKWHEECHAIESDFDSTKRQIELEHMEDVFSLMATMGYETHRSPKNRPYVILDWAKILKTPEEVSRVFRSFSPVTSKDTLCFVYEYGLKKLEDVIKYY